MSTSELISKRVVSNAYELHEELDNIGISDVIHVMNKHGEPVTVKYVVDTLTDGSNVWNIILE